MNRPLSRRSFLAAAGMAMLAGCSGVGSQVEGANPAGSGTGGAGASGSGGDGFDFAPGSDETPISSATPGASSPPVAGHQLPLPLSPDDLRGRAVSGGPPKDGIPAIEQPKFIPASQADSWLDPEDIVFGVSRNGEVKAYPQTILVFHEICNDVLGGDPVSITYCPLTGTAIGIERGETTFGVSGRLINNNLIMYDRRTQLWWPQVLSTSIPSPWNSEYATQSLRDFRLVWTTWERWKAAHPDTEVLSRDTGYVRNYSGDPYGSYVPDRKGYYAPNAGPMFAPLNSDDRYAPKRVVIGARTTEGAIAFLKNGLRDKKLISGDLAGTPHLGVYDRALDTAYIYRNPEGESFEYRDGEIVAGDGTAHAPDALPLERDHAFDAMWFAWIGFYPESSVYE